MYQPREGLAPQNQESSGSSNSNNYYRKTTTTTSDPKINYGRKLELELYRQKKLESSVKTNISKSMETLTCKMEEAHEEGRDDLAMEYFDKIEDFQSQLDEVNKNAIQSEAYKIDLELQKLKTSSLSIRSISVAAQNQEQDKISVSDVESLSRETQRLNQSMSEKNQALGALDVLQHQQNEQDQLSEQAVKSIMNKNSADYKKKKQEDMLGMINKRKMDSASAVPKGSVDNPTSSKDEFQQEIDKIRKKYEPNKN